jgi:uncharacterized protein (DUF2237 family)
MAQNVLGGELVSCCENPMSGFFRTGKCETNSQDKGMHTVCALMNDEFLAFSRQHGNDLSSPRPEFAFPGLKAGDFWCVCLARWLQAHQSGTAPRVKLEATHISVLEFIDLKHLKEYAIDTP